VGNTTRSMLSLTLDYYLLYEDHFCVQTLNALLTRLLHDEGRPQLYQS
jgi:hypothetical protein